MNNIFRLMLLVLVFLVQYPAYAGCTWEWICDGSGNCSQQPLCDSTLDIPPPRPPSVQPIAPPSVRPIEEPRVPPVGTSNCTKVQRTDGYGNWYWDTVCY